MRYASTSPKRPRSIDDRNNNGMPVFVQERFEEKQQKRVSVAQYWTTYLNLLYVEIRIENYFPGKLLSDTFSLCF